MEKYTYEQAITRLDEIISVLEKNEVSLDESIVLYEEGIELVKYCDSKLKNIENRVTKIFEDNHLVEYEGENND